MMDVLKKAEKLLVQLNELIEKNPTALSVGYHPVIRSALVGTRKRIEWLKINAQQPTDKE